MARKCKIPDFLSYVKMSHNEYALNVLKDVETELKIAKKIEYISRFGKKSLELIEEIIKAVINGKIEDAKPKCTDAAKWFSGHVKNHLETKLKEIEDVQGLPKDKPTPTRGKLEKPRNDQRSRDSVDNVEHSNGTRKSEHTKQKTEQHQNENADLVTDLGRSEKSDSKRGSNTARDGNVERSKRASLKMRQNNPDIADLSDPNRPTKIAEKFSELYDNEWTEAFEELSKKSRKEEECIEILLVVVTEAYKFCKEAAENQIKKITKTWNAIFEFGPDKFENESPYHSAENDAERESLIIQYRKKIASIALPNLKQKFSETKIISVKSKAKLPKTLSAFDSYVDKAVELTWWMCVQDPPIFLCSQTDGEGFDKNLYRAYTKSGSSPEFFVWPALRLYKGGGVLMKGVVQFK